jgi:hypothetical protein
VLGEGRSRHCAPAAHDARGLRGARLGHHRLRGQGPPGRHPRGPLRTEKSFDDGLGGAYNAWALGAFVADVVENSLGKPASR